MRAVSQFTNLPGSASHLHEYILDFMSAGSTPAGDIQSHLYRAFLDGRTSDVALHVRGSWEGIYKLHRVVLIQAGFFRSLFDGGFREAVNSHGIEVNVTFDDPNITRAAFEICISRLYGGGPTLYVDPRLIPSRREPLTPGFPRPIPTGKVPVDHHYASPRFLLSLLATATYLSIPSLVSQTIMHVLNSVGPHTVLRYLNFAIGKGIGEKEQGDPDAAVGLENICLKFESSTAESSRSVSTKSISEQHDVSSLTQVFDDLSTVQKEDPSGWRASESGSLRSVIVAGELGADENDLAFLYGLVSDKIGEAAVCWLCRWGTDMLPYEESLEPEPSTSFENHAGPSRRRDTISTMEGPPVYMNLTKSDIPVIWRRNGLSAKWIRAILSSDTFFVKSEKERYDLAKRIVELRRRVSIDEVEEREWDILFSRGIHYMHMSLDDLIDISHDLSPIKGKPYTPTAVLQSSHWEQSLLRHHITVRPVSVLSSTAPPRSPGTTRDKELALAQTTSDLLASLSGLPENAQLNKQQLFYPVPVDSSSRIGDRTGLDSSFMDQLAEPHSQVEKSGKKVSSTPNSLSNFFGILEEGRTVSACVKEDNTGKKRWSPFPPIRFGVEFWGVEALKEKSRLHSQTIWYAGSLYNVYVQVVRKKGLQLGVYLHRQSSVDPIPIPSAPPLSPSHSERASPILAGSHSASTIAIPTSFSTPSLPRPVSRGGSVGPQRSTTPTSAVSVSPSTYHGIPATLHISPPAQPYRDPRPAVLAYFTILCASQTGSSLTRFSSAPDVFSVSQSWGWKSSTLQTEEYIELSDGDVPVIPSLSKETSLRATVVLGVV